MGARGDTAGILVAGMGADDGLGQRRRWFVIARRGKERRDLSLQRIGVGWIEGAGDGGMTDRGQGRVLSLAKFN